MDLQKTEFKEAVDNKQDLIKYFKKSKKVDDATE